MGCVSVLMTRNMFCIVVTGQVFSCSLVRNKNNLVGPKLNQVKLLVTDFGQDHKVFLCLTTNMFLVTQKVVGPSQFGQSTKTQPWWSSGRNYTFIRAFFVDLLQKPYEASSWLISKTDLPSHCIVSVWTMIIKFKPFSRSALFTLLCNLLHDQ